MECHIEISRPRTLYPYWNWSSSKWYLGRNCWNWSKLTFQIPQSITEQAFEISLNSNITDTPYWGLNSNGIFSTKSIYKLSQAPPRLNRLLLGSGTKIHFNKIIFFLWLCSHNRLPTNDYLNHLGFHPEPTCSVCKVANTQNYPPCVFRMPHLQENSARIWAS